MSSEWRTVRLGDTCLKIGSGVTPRGGDKVYKMTGISLIRSQNVYDFTFDYNGLVFVDEEQADKMKNVEVISEDILLNITGDSVARCCIVPEKVLPARVNQHVSIIRPRQEIINPIRESVQAKMKMTIKRLLKKYGYPPDKTLKAVDIVMEQTKLMCSNEVVYAPSVQEKSLDYQAAEESENYK